MGDSDLQALNRLPTQAVKVQPWASEVCRLVNERYEELGEFQEKLDNQAKNNRVKGHNLKVSLIVLGAFSATKGTFDVLMDPGSLQSIALFTILGVVTAMVAGLSAAFKYEESAGKLAGLAAEVASTRGMILYTWDKILLEHAGTLAAITEGSEVKLIEGLLERLNVKTGHIYTRAAGLGVQPPKGPHRLKEFGDVDMPQPDARDRSLPHMEPAKATA